MQVYLDNAATSYPKPDAVVKAVTESLLSAGGNANRSFGAMALERAVYETRERLCQFFNFEAVDHVVFTKNITESLNIVLQGYLQDGDVALTTSIEHNAVMRPLKFLEQTRNVQIEIVPVSKTGALDFSALEKALKKKPKLFVATSGSNLTGDFFDLEAVGCLCKRYGVPFFLDGAQRAGVQSIDMAACHIDVLAFTGHKSLLGPQGIGGLLIRPEIASQVKPLIYGGTGSASDSLEQPSLMPDKLEAGTGNLPGILGLNAALGFLMAEGTLERLFAHKVAMIERLQRGVERLEGITVLGHPNPERRLGVLALDFKTIDNSEMAYLLNKQFNIITRVGMHCAPMAHETFGSYPQGAVRFSVSYATTVEEIDYTVEAISKILGDEGESYG